MSEKDSTTLFMSLVIRGFMKTKILQTFKKLKQISIKRIFNLQNKRTDLKYGCWNNQPRIGIL